MAEGEGFEPPVPCGTHDFESCAFNQALPPLRVCNGVYRSGFRPARQASRFRSGHRIAFTNEASAKPLRRGRDVSFFPWRLSANR